MGRKVGREGGGGKSDDCAAGGRTQARGGAQDRDRGGDGASGAAQGRAQADHQQAREGEGSCRPSTDGTDAVGADAQDGRSGKGGQRMLGLVTPDDHGEERQFLLPPATGGHPEPGPGDPPSVCRSSGWSVRLPAKLALASVMVLPSWDGLAGRSAVSLAPGGWWTPGHANRPQGQAMEPTKSAIDQDRRPWPARVPGWLVECLRLGVGHASTVRPDPSTLGVVGERGSRHEGRSPARSR